MNFAQAVDLLNEGKKVRLPEWVGYWFSDPEKGYMAFTRTGDIVKADVPKFLNRDDWEEVTIGQGFDWALLAMKSGKRSKREVWANDKYIYILNGKWTCSAFDRDEREAILSLDDVLAADWVLAE